jgi:Substrate binding domain of ABC-type glycine betaine transport system
VSISTRSIDPLTEATARAPEEASSVLRAAWVTSGGPEPTRTLFFHAAQPAGASDFRRLLGRDDPIVESGPLSVAALKNGEVQVVELFSSDGNVVSNNFVALTDNKHLEGADYIVPVIRKSVDTTGVAKILNTIDAKLTTGAISRLNLDVTAKQEQPAAVAQTWLTSVGG